jgi:hypothetical protein
MNSSNPYEVDRYVASGEVVQQSYVYPSPDSRAHQRIMNGAKLYTFGLAHLREYDRARLEITDGAPELSGVAEAFGSDLVRHIRGIINRYMSGSF